MNTLKLLVRGFFSLFPGPTFGDFLKLQEEVLEKAAAGTPGYQLHRWSEWEHHLDRMERAIRKDAGIPAPEALPKNLHLGKKSARHLAELRTYVACKVDELVTAEHTATVSSLRAMNARFEHRVGASGSPALAA